MLYHWPLTRYAKLRVGAWAGKARNFFPRHRLQRKPQFSDPGMHHGTCVTHVPWCMLGSLTHDGGRNVPGIPNACAARNFTYLVRCPFPLGGLKRLARPGGSDRTNYCWDYTDCPIIKYGLGNWIMIKYSSYLIKRKSRDYVNGIW